MNSLRVARKEKGWTLQNLSILSGITVPHLSFLENGKAVPTEITRVRLEGILEWKNQWH